MGLFNWFFGRFDSWCGAIRCVYARDQDCLRSYYDVRVTIHTGKIDVLYCYAKRV